MLPSKGYFKGIICSFYDNGLCERPYCHFRHVKKESHATSSDRIESGAFLQKLVSAAVQKVLQQTETSSSSTASQQAAIDSAVDVNTKVNNVQLMSKATYNPTPISELKKINNTHLENIEEVTEHRKKHIPVPYTPRKPASVPIKRPVEDNGTSKPFVYNPLPVKYTPGGIETAQLDPYTPKGSTESNEKYLPGNEIELQEYTPKESQLPCKRNYVPSDKNNSKKKILEYKPIKVSSQIEIPPVTYQPTLKYLAPCFSSDEDETDTKKIKLSCDLNDLDDLGPEFDILDQILDEEKFEENMTNSATTANKLEENINNDKKPEETTNNTATTHKKPEESRNNNATTHKKPEECRNNAATTLKKPEESRNNNATTHKKPEECRNNAATTLKKPDENRNNTASRHKMSKEKAKDNKESRQKIDDNKKSASSDKNENKKSQDKIKAVKKERALSENKNKHESTSKISDKESHKISSNDTNRKKHNEKYTDQKSHSSSDRSSKHSEHRSSKDDRSKHSNRSESYSKRKDERPKSTKKSKEKPKKTNEDPVCNDLSGDEGPHGDDVVIVENDVETYDISESDEETIALECKRIFEEYIPQEKTKNVENMANNLLEDNDNEYVPGKKRISRTTGKDIKILPKATVKPNYKVKAAQAMAERLTKTREYHVAKNANDSVNNDSDFSKYLLPTSTTGNSKIRIAHVPYASTLMSAKKTITPKPYLKKEEPSTSSTVVQTIKRGTQRVAHIPNEKFIDRPGVLEPLASKIAANIRSTYLNMMIDECLKIYLSATDAYARAQHEELATSKKCSTVQIYKNSAVLTVSRLRKELQECNGIKKSGSDCAMLQKIPQAITGNTSNSGSWSIESKNRRIIGNAQEFSGSKLYNNIKKWLLTEEQLQANGFPRCHPSAEKGRAMIYSENKTIPPKGVIRTCCRCNQDYIVDKKGFSAVKADCIYHPNNKYRVRGESKYQCCSQDVTSDGCCIAPCHVYGYVDYNNLKGYVKTLPPDSVMDDYGVYALDCEMCYTTNGLDLTRVTVINSACKVVYETFIMPLHPIIDYNTRYSGITEEQMTNVKTTLLDVQANLLAMFNSKTILIGHSLESDFKALKLIHDTVIDTSVLYPHKMGHPCKRALRNLSSEYLKKIIQNSVEGHDSAEDATVCMELILYKLKDDLKTR